MTAKTLRAGVAPIATRLCAPLLALAASSTVAAQVIPDLTDDERAAIETITQGKVLGTLRFLACDEMQGRDTGSPELKIASAYVAARFAGAGLEGLGEDGSFYLYARSRVLPASGLVLSESLGAQSAKIPATLLACGSERLESAMDVTDCKGGLQRRDFGEGLHDIALVDEAPAREMRGMSPADSKLFSTLRQMRLATRAGARVLMIRCAKDSALRRVAREGGLAKSRFAGSLAQLEIPAILVAQDFDTGRYSLTVPSWDFGRSENRNVCGVLRGSDPELAKEAVLITAHLDHVGIGGRGDDRIRNGADDNATGSTAVLTLADAFASLGKRPKRSVIFMTFWGEERGLLGSREFARTPAWPLGKIVANVNIEMIGRPDDSSRGKSWMTGWNKSDLGKLMALGAKRSGFEIYRHKRFSAMLYQRSDNWSFAEKGVIAHSFSGSTLHKDYHQPGDEWQKIEIPNMTRVIRGLFSGVLPLAHGLLTPKAR